MAKNEKSSKELASLAGKVLQQKTSTKTAKNLAGSVLTQAPDRKSQKKKIVCLLSICLRGMHMCPATCLRSAPLM